MSRIRLTDLGQQQGVIGALETETESPLLWEAGLFISILFNNCG